MRIQPKLNKTVTSFLEEKDIIFKASKTKASHFCFPEIITKRSKEIKSKFPEIDFYIAHKATKSLGLLKIVKENNLNIDVSSENELKNALKLKFKKIGCSGPKNDSYLNLAIKNDCLISIDSIEELNRINNKKSTILIRISDPLVSNRNLIKNKSKFGILKDELDEVYKILKKNKNITLKGFHFHKDGFDPGMKAGIIEYFLEETLRARNLGFFPDVINLGGGIKTQSFENPNEWHNYIKQIQEKIIQKEEINETWNEQNFGISLNSKNKIEGREKAQQPATNIDSKEFISQILNSKSKHKITIRQLLTECNVKLILEPGQSFFYDSGISVLPVIGSKKTVSGNLLVLNVNMFTLSSRMFEPLEDPILLTKNKKRQKFDCFLAGNLCREDDIIMNRKIEFNTKPKNKDLLVFLNTGAYKQSYEASNPQLQDSPNKYLALKINNKWKIKNDI